MWNKFKWDMFITSFLPLWFSIIVEEALNQIGDQPVFLWAFKENKRARRFYEKHGFRWDGSERVSEFDGALEVRYVKG